MFEGVFLSESVQWKDKFWVEEAEIIPAEERELSEISFLLDIFRVGADEIRELAAWNGRNCSILLVLVWRVFEIEDSGVGVGGRTDGCVVIGSVKVMRKFVA